MNLQTIWDEVASHYCQAILKREEFFKEIMSHYRQLHRHYHTSQHLKEMFAQLLPLKNSIEDWTSIVFATFFHDIIYWPTRSDNEEQSALKAMKIMEKLGVEEEGREKVRRWILITKTHEWLEDEDLQFFLDSDLAILGTPPSRYDEYRLQIRQEYKSIPDEQYRKGRIKVLQHFLQMDNIFKSEFFYRKFEEKARENLLREIEELNVVSEEK